MNSLELIDVNTIFGVLRCPKDNRITEFFTSGDYYELGLIREMSRLMGGMTDITAIDCGACVGSWTVPMCGLFSKVFAIEMEPWLCHEVLPHNVKANAVVINAAVLDRPGTVGQTKAPAYYLESRGVKAGDSLIVFRLDDMFLPAGQSTVSPIRGYTKHKRVGFIKMDIEGSEPWALIGAEGILTRDRPVVFYEYIPELVRETANLLGRPVPAEPKTILQDLNYVVVGSRSSKKVYVGMPVEMARGIKARTLYGLSPR